MIPLKYPHFGGLRQADVKSVKYHLKGGIGNLLFNYEEFETMIIQVEGILNIRTPIAVFNGFGNFEVLTPVHFLIGRSINAILETIITDTNIYRLNLWQKTMRVFQTPSQNGSLTIYICYSKELNG